MGIQEPDPCPKLPSPNNIDGWQALSISGWWFSPKCGLPFWGGQVSGVGFSWTNHMGGCMNLHDWISGKLDERRCFPRCLVD
jgi:hypothetical protein